MFFYIVNTVTCTLKGTRWKHYVCDQCCEPYHYPVTKTITETGQTFFWLFLGSLMRGVKRNARRKLDAIADSDSDPCPCPSCGAYQRGMFRTLAKGRYKWMGWAAAACLPLWLASECLLFSLDQPDANAMPARELEEHKNAVAGFACLLTFAWFFIATSFLVACVIRRWCFDPNSAIPAADRLEEARRLAHTDAEYEAYLQTEAADRTEDEGEEDRDTRPEAADRFIGRALLFGLAVGAGVGGVWGHDALAPGWAGALGGALLGTFGGFLAGLIIGLVVALVMKLSGGENSDTTSVETVDASHTR
jgi:hypothetical protein